jgi:hypothetical protein
MAGIIRVTWSVLVFIFTASEQAHESRPEKWFGCLKGIYLGFARGLLLKTAKRRKTGVDQAK